MKNAKIFAAVLAVSVTSAALYAAPGDAPARDKAVTKAQMLAKADTRFAKLDANADGVLNEADKAAMVANRFAAMDTDRNGSISQAEFSTANEARTDKREDRREKRMGRGSADGKKGRHGGDMKMLARADTNGDKAVSQNEFRAAAEARFTRMDANNDGTITADERKANRGKWRDRSATPADAG